MRKYEPIWNTLKRKGTAAISAPISEHLKIRKAVTKEKYQDTAYNFEQSEKGTLYDLVIETQGKLMTFSFKPTERPEWRKGITV